MTDPLLNGDLRTRPSSTQGPLPTDFIEAASRRLGIACLVWAGLWAFGLLMNNVVGPILSPEEPLDDAWPWPGNPAAFVVILVSLSLYAYTRWHACDCRISLHLGLLYEVGLAFAIGIVNQWTPNDAGLSWICVLVLIHPMIVPHKRRWTFLAALAAASMDPVGLAITKARGVSVPPLPVILWTYLPNYLCALLAVLPSHIVARMGREVREARELGSYQLGELLGRGGMGEVYRASHRFFRRPAAIKLIRTANAGDVDPALGETALLRFKREAEIAANLHSPHTIALYDFGATRNGDLYYVMELLRGLDLNSLVKRFGPLPPARVVYLLQQACHSLSEAHANALVHRDIKPANLFTCWLGLEADFLKVLDFGLAKWHSGHEREEIQLTRPEITAGTPAFMAPELARGGSVDGRTDLYALGCVAYWLLVGRLLFEAESSMKLILAHVEKKPRAPSLDSEFEISPALDEVVLACLEKDARNRPANAEDLARQLAHCEVGEPWTQESATRWWQRHLPELIPGAQQVVP